MKKTLSLLLLLLVLVTSVFASHRVSVAIDPFSCQSFVQKDEEGSRNFETSRYGIGGSIGYSWINDKGFMFGADIKADTYMLDGQKSFTDVSFLGTAGYSFSTYDAVHLFANGKLGLDIQTHTGNTSAVLQFGPELGVSFDYIDHVEVFASVECLFGFPRDEGIRYSEFRITQTLGLEYTF